MPTPEKTRKLIVRLKTLAQHLAENNDFTIHQNISQFSHMQRAAELELLQQQCEEVSARLKAATTQLGEIYQRAYCQWRRDSRWLNHNVMSRNGHAE